ncbi:MAG: GNAT family N-acetyltransferase [Terriglobales bacterium]
MEISIEDLRADQEERITRTAELLVAAFVKTSPSAWDIHSARQEVRESLAPDRISRVALRHGTEVVGWIGGIPSYHGHVFDLHPLAVRPDMQGQGIGALLVRDFERIVYERGAATIYLGTDDEDGRTSLSRCDLYDNPQERMANVRNLGRHPFQFYQKMGYSIVGVLPDANGPGKPDIFMAKRVPTPFPA